MFWRVSKGEHLLVNRNARLRPTSHPFTTPKRKLVFAELCILHWLVLQGFCHKLLAKSVQCPAQGLGPRVQPEGQVLLYDNEFKAYPLCGGMHCVKNYEAIIGKPCAYLVKHVV